MVLAVVSKLFDLQQVTRGLPQSLLLRDVIDKACVPRGLEVLQILATLGGQNGRMQQGVGTLRGRLHKTTNDEGQHLKKSETSFTWNQKDQTVSKWIGKGMIM